MSDMLRTHTHGHNICDCDREVKYSHGSARTAERRSWQKEVEEELDNLDKTWQD